MIAEAEVRSAGVWQFAHPIAWNTWLPLAMELAPPGFVVEGVGGARRRMNIANCTTSLGTAESGDAVILVPSSGVGLILHSRGRPPRCASSGLARSFWNNSLVTPIS